jgi:plasmid stability protein
LDCGATGYNQKIESNHATSCLLHKLAEIANSEHTPHPETTLQKGSKKLPFAIMATLVIKSFPEHLHAKLRQSAAVHRRSVTQETIHLIETAIAGEDQMPPAPAPSYWATRKLLPEFEAALEAGAFSGGTDSTQIISEERDAR